MVPLGWRVNGGRNVFRMLQSIDAGHRVDERNGVVSCTFESGKGSLRKFRFVMNEDYTGGHGGTFAVCRTRAETVYRPTQATIR
jgi:hypothetical protein